MYRISGQFWLLAGAFMAIKHIQLVIKINKIFKVRGQRLRLTQSWIYIPGFEILSRDTQIAFERKKERSRKRCFVWCKKKNLDGQIQFTTFVGEDFTSLCRLLTLRDQMPLLIIKDHILNNVVWPVVSKPCIINLIFNHNF